MPILHKLISSYGSARQRGSDKPVSSRLRLLLRAAVVTLFLMVGGYLTMSAFKVGQGVSRSSLATVNFARVQLVDASGGEVSLANLSRQLTQLSDSLLDISVVEQDRFVTRPLEHSLVVSRESDLTSARLLAARLGLTTENIEHRPLELNLRQANVSVILGRDIVDGRLFSGVDVGN